MPRDQDMLPETDANSVTRVTAVVRATVRMLAAATCSVPPVESQGLS